MHRVTQMPTAKMMKTAKRQGVTSGKSLFIFNLYSHFETMVTSSMVQCKVALDPSNIMLEIATLPTKICSLIQNIPRTYLFLKHIQIKRPVHTKKIIMMVMKHMLPNI